MEDALTFVMLRLNATEDCGYRLLICHGGDVAAETESPTPQHISITVTHLPEQY